MKKKIIFALYFLIFCSLYAKEDKSQELAKFISGQKKLEAKINKKGEEKKLYPEHYFYPIIDGVADPEEFLKRKVRVMFVLKEGYDEYDEDGNPLGGGFMMTEGDKYGNYEYVSLTWKRILQISYGIFNKKFKFEKIPQVASKISFDEEYAKILKSIIYINTNKMPAKASSNDSDVQQHFYFWEDIIAEQVSFYEPQIIIFCGTYKFYKNSFKKIFNTSGVSETAIKKYPDARVVKGAFTDEQNRLFIHAVHPGNPYIAGGDEKYFTEVLNVFKDYKKGKFKK